jgi:hypothetical protein
VAPQVANLPQVVVLKSSLSFGSVPLASTLALLLCSAACADSDLSNTLVRFQGGKPNASWNLELTSDAGTDAAQDAALDGGEQHDASTVDASSDDADEDAGTGTGTGQTATACTFRLTTRAQGGRYAPKNIGAIWIEREDGTWVKTLKVWAGVRLRYLTTYLKTNTQRDTTDALTSATLRQHATHEVKWNLKDAQGQLAADGDYRVRVEVTDRSGDGKLLSVPFSKSDQALKVAPDDSEFFVDVELDCS